jgi:hypothetical protein
VPETAVAKKNETPKHPLYRLVKKFTNKEPMRDEKGEQLLEVVVETKDADGKSSKHTAQMTGSQVSEEQRKAAKPLFRDVELEIPPHWAPWVITAEGEYRPMRPGDECSLREDYIASLGNQVELVSGAKPPTPAPAPAPVE